MKKYPVILATSALTLSAAMGSCDNSSTIGQSLVQDKIEVVVDSAFTLVSQCQPIGHVQSRTISQLIGRIDAPGFGRLSSDVVTQFMPSSQIVTVGVKPEYIDSLMLYMLVATGEYVGDSISPMGIDVYRLNRNLPSPIYSDFDPEGYYDPEPIGSAIYNLANMSRDTMYTQGIEVKVKLPLELGKELFNAYVSNKSNFLSPTAFVDNVFKGVYIKNSFGSGRLMRSSSTLMSLYYHFYEGDSLINCEGNYFAVTPEIITNNDINLEISPKIDQMVQDGAKVVMAPVGLELGVEFPAKEIIQSYRSNTSDLRVLNTVTFSMPGRPISNEFNFGMPTYLLMVLTKDKDEFFANNSLPDNITSFYATLDSDSQIYSFGDMRAYISQLLDKDEIKPEDYTFSVIPVSASFESSTSSYYYYETSSSLSMMTPYVASPVMAELLPDQAKIKLTFSTQTITK